MPDDLDNRCRKLVADLGLGGESDVSGVRPLTGGVSSDIAVVSLGERRICVKFALPKLKVEADWHASVHRNAAEYAWLEVAATVSPDSAIELYGRSEELNGFAMEYVESEDAYLWKTNLLAEEDDQGEAVRVAELLGRIHAESTKQNFNSSPFQNHEDFRALRLEPYFTHTSKAHPKLAEPLEAIERMLAESRQVLLHGDVSPKNILFRSVGPVLLDGECATMGDASFDPAFCMNHLILKAIHLPDSQSRLLADVKAFWETYLQHVCWENGDSLETRVCKLLPALALARIDGKSPVEYLDEPNRAFVRRVAPPLVQEPVTELGKLVESIASQLKDRL